MTLAWRASYALHRRLRRARFAGISLAARLRPRPRATAGSLLVMLHSVFADRAEMLAAGCHPLQAVTVDDLRALLVAVRQAGLRPMAVEDLSAGPSEGPGFVLTFDDGYANNRRALPLLAEAAVPATVFLATGAIMRQRCFWWDVAYREWRAEGAIHPTIERRLRALKAEHRTSSAIESWLVARYGEAAFAPVGEADRPLTPAEVAQLAATPGISLGNHTRGHDYLPELDDAAIRASIDGCQADIVSLGGRAPVAIAYPNGDHDPRVAAMARAAGLRFGITSLPGLNPPLGSGDPDAAMRLRRFAFRGGLSAERQLALWLRGDAG